MNLFLPEMVSVSIVLGVVGVNNQNVEANLKKNNTFQIKNEKISVEESFSVIGGVVVGESPQ